MDPPAGVSLPKDSAPLLHACETPPEVLCPALGPSVQGHGPGVSADEYLEDDQRTWVPLL